MVFIVGREFEKIYQSYRTMAYPTQNVGCKIMTDIWNSDILNLQDILFLYNFNCKIQIDC